MTITTFKTYNKECVKNLERSLGHLKINRKSAATTLNLIEPLPNILPHLPTSVQSVSSPLALLLENFYDDVSILTRSTIYIGALVETSPQFYSPLNVNEISSASIVPLYQT